MEDLFESHAYFETQSPGLGAKFLGKVFDALERIESFPRAWVRTRRKFWLCQLTKFRKYGVLYRIGRGSVYVHRLIHLQRGPALWKEVLK